MQRLGRRVLADNRAKCSFEVFNQFSSSFAIHFSGNEDLIGTIALSFGQGPDKPHIMWTPNQFHDTNDTIAIRISGSEQNNSDLQIPWIIHGGLIKNHGLT